jgi:hypothetical protein
MPNPINFSVPAAARADGFTFTSNAVAKPAGYTRIYWELDIPNVAEYEDIANEIDTFVVIDGVESESVWPGGRAVNKQGTVDFAPAYAYDISAVPTGASLQVRFLVKKAMTVGIKNGAVT